MNSLDIGIIILVALCAFVGYRRGLIRTVYRLVSFFIAIFLAWTLYPHVARFLRATPLFYSIQRSVKNTLNLEGFVTEYTADRQYEIIESLPIPNALRELLHNQYTPDVHGILRVDTVEEHISAFFANIAINGIAILTVFFLVLIGLLIAGVALDIVSKLPVINTFNKVGGLIFGAIMGGGIVWLGLMVMSFLFANNANPEMYDLMDGSLVGRWVMDSMMPRLTVVGE